MTYIVEDAPHIVRIAFIEQTTQLLFLLCCQVTQKVGVRPTEEERNTQSSYLGVPLSVDQPSHELCIQWADMVSSTHH